MTKNKDGVSAKEVEDQLGIDRKTLLLWENEGIINPSHTSGGHRRYDLNHVADAIAQENINKNPDAPQPPPYHEFGITGLKRQGGTILEERLKELRGYAGRVLKREMRLNDPVLGAMFFGISTAMRAPFSHSRVVPASDNARDRATAEFIETCFQDMSWDMKTQSTMIIDEFLEQGFAVDEVVYKRRYGEDPPEYMENPATSLFSDGKIGWRKWSPRPATSLYSGNEWIFDDNDGIIGINQAIDAQLLTRKVPYRSIPIEKLLHFRTTPHPANNPEGMSIHRPAYTSWWAKTNLEEMESIGIERDLGGIPVVYLGKGTSKSGTLSDFAYAQDLVVNIRNDDQTGIVIPHQKLDNDGNGVLVELLASPSRRSHNTNDIITRYNKLIAMTTLSQFLFLGMDNVGSYALIQYEGDLFSLAIKSLLDSILSVINRFAIPKLVRLNGFNHSEGYPELTVGNVGIPNLEVFSKFVNEMVGQDVITVDDELEQSIRQIGGLPPMSATIQTGRERKPNMQMPLFGEQGTGQDNQNNNQTQNMQKA